MVISRRLIIGNTVGLRLWAWKGGDSAGRIIESFHDAGETAVEPVRKFIDTVNGVVPDVSADCGPRQKIIDSAFKMTEHCRNATELAQRLVKAGQDGLGGQDPGWLGRARQRSLKALREESHEGPTWENESGGGIRVSVSSEPRGDRSSLIDSVHFDGRVTMNSWSGLLPSTWR